ncbi:CRAL-TRIO domain-containing protein isoform B [Sphaceloma murrayae]|uniref:CRAL-TRIO domain-containing protein isoform B n=1 Tax=Sphaceloma murrayae TaxID=2082308 RepID=A0A2K1QW36_9PEZI|nr:CRAL-TRIO domain-containing protein isoform B [Sphaceloma murrayae]
MSAAAPTQQPDELPALHEKKPIESARDVTSSTQSTRPASITSNDSFKSVSSQQPTEPTSTAPSTPPRSHGPTRTPLTALSNKSKPPGFPKLTAQHEAMYAQVLAAVANWSSVPESTAKGAKSVPMTEDEHMWLSRECLLRYLRATKWSVPNALKRLQGTLSWRREYGADTFTGDYISPENETGKQVIMGWDNDGRPCLYLNPGRQNTKMSDRQIHHLCFMLDRTLDMIPPGQETSCLLINFKGASAGAVPTVGQAKAVLNILQNHNPERLGKALISELPWYVSTFFKLISPFIDPVTRDKMKFQPVLRDFLPPEQLWNEFGGDLDFEYDHKAYWSALMEETKRRKDAYRQRWIDGGKRIGEYEEYLRGGDRKSLVQELNEAEKVLAQETQKLAV